MKRYYTICTTRPQNCDTWFTTKSGLKLFLPVQFQLRIDLKGLMYYITDDNHFPTLSQLVESGELVEEHIYNEYTVIPKDQQSIDVKAILEEFRSHGFYVTPAAVEHNFLSWEAGLKSGFRDEKNGYHLFSPCGGNPLSFTATSLDPACKGWQLTYEV